MTKAKNEFEHLAQFAADLEGYEGINMDTMAIPFIRILQALSPQLKKTKPEYVAGAEEGMVCNSVTGRLYATPLRIVIGKFERLYIEWKPKRGGFVAAHAPESVDLSNKYLRDDKGKLIDKETLNELVDTYMYYVLLPDYVEDGVCIMSMSSSQLKEAKKLNRVLMTTVIPGTSAKAMPHYMVFELNTIERSNDQGEWFAPVFSFESFVNPDLLSNIVEQRKALPNKTVDYALIDENAGKSEPLTDDVKY